MPSIGKYEILEQLGSGSMGTVYKGRDTLLDRMVALKTIRTGANLELEAKERFYREARTCARLNHPHIVSVYDLGEENGTSFIAMELLFGSDFQQLINDREPLPLTIKLTAMAQICDALAHAHREGIVHRDIKPSNLFLLEDGRAKVVDFGIAKLPTAQVPRNVVSPGTMNYMAPEQINGLPYDGRADLFAAAIVFYELITFQHPFQGSQVTHRILTDKPDSLTDHDPNLPASLEDIFTRALAKEPSQRYLTGDDFAADLRSALEAAALYVPPRSFSTNPPVLNHGPETSFSVPEPLIPAPPQPQSHPSATAKILADKKRLVMVVAGMIVALVLLIVAPTFFRSVGEERFVATARVAAPQAQILSAAEDRGKEIVSKTRGAQVNILALPKSLSSGWARVQAHEGDTFSRPGYIKAADLTDWDAKDPNAALALARLSGPMENGTDAEIRSQIEHLNSVAAALHGKPQASTASLDAAGLDLILARRAKASGQPAVDWQASFAELANRVEELRKVPALQSASDNLLRQIHDVLSTQPPQVATDTVAPSPLTPPDPPKELDVTELLQSANQLRKEHRYNDARRIAARALRLQPKNSDAQLLLSKIDAALELERSAQ